MDDKMFFCPECLKPITELETELKVTGTYSLEHDEYDEENKNTDYKCPECHKRIADDYSTMKSLVKGMMPVKVAEIYITPHEPHKVLSMHILDYMDTPLDLYQHENLRSKLEYMDTMLKGYVVIAPRSKTPDERTGVAGSI